MGFYNDNNSKLEHQQLEAISAVTSLLTNYHHVTIPENHNVEEDEIPY
ncbi:13318_t:CDS:2 [Rhizophagus irregularis]|nr:13318_t:CDS:2 [Rhizophagus irregularis]